MMGYYNPNYVMIPLVGEKEGISGSSIGGFNMAINKYITSTQKKYAIEAIKYMSSKEVQKDMILNQRLLSGIYDLYNDDDVCNIFDCELIKKFQPIPRPSNLTDDYDEYSKEFRRIFNEFLYENKTASDALKEISYLATIYYISINPKKTIEGLILFIITIIVILIITFSLIFLFIDKYKKCYKFLPKKFWFLFIIGLIMNICFIFTDYGNLTNIKCYLKIVLISFGFNVRESLIFQRLVINFPNKSEIIKWIKKNNYVFFLGILIINIVLYSLFFISPFKTKLKIVQHGKNYRYCVINDKLKNGLAILILILNGLVFISIGLLIFMEWNIKKTVRDIRLILITIYTDLLMFTLLFIIFVLQFDNYELIFCFKATIILLSCTANYIIMYASRIFWNRNDFNQSFEQKQIIDDALNMFKTSTTSYETTKTDNSSLVRQSVLSKMMEYHNYLGSEPKIVKTFFDNTTQN